MYKPFLIFVLALPASLSLSLLPNLAPVVEMAGAPGLSSVLADFGQAKAQGVGSTADGYWRGRTKLKRRAQSFRMVAPATTNAEAASADFELTYVDGDGETVSDTGTASAPAIEKAYFDWTPPSDFAGGSVNVSCSGCTEDLSGLSVDLGVEDDWDGDNEDWGDSGLSLRVWRRGDGSYRFRIKGKPSDISGLGFDSGGGTPDGTLVVGAAPLDYQFSRNIWRQDFIVPEGTDLNQVAIVGAKALDADGNVLEEVAGTVAADNEAERDGIVLERVRFTETGKGDLKVRADAFTNDRTHIPTLNLEANDANGDELLALSGEAPTHTEFQYTSLFDLAEVDNFNDLTYIVSVEAHDAADNQIANFDITHVVTETFDSEAATGTSGDWEYALTVALVEDYETEEGPFDGGFVRLALAGDNLPDVAKVIVRLIPDDGGSELDNAGDDGDPDTVELDFAGAWHVWTAKGNNGAGGLGDGTGDNPIVFSTTVAGNGDFEAGVGEIDLVVDSASGEGNAYRTAGFGKGTKAHTSKTSARPELQ